MKDFLYYYEDNTMAKIKAAYVEYSGNWAIFKDVGGAVVRAICGSPGDEVSINLV